MKKKCKKICTVFEKVLSLQYKLKQKDMENTIEKRLSQMSEEEMKKVLLLITKICQRKDDENVDNSYYRGLCVGSNIQKKLILEFILEQH